VLSSGVAGKAAGKVLQLDANATLQLHHGIEIEWLEQSIQSIGQRPMPGEPGERTRQTPRSTGQSRDEGYNDMMRQLKIHGDRYMKQSSSEDSATEKDRNQTDAPGMMMGGVGGGMMGSMGMGGMGMGGMYGGPAPQSPRAGVEQNAMLKLSVQLPEDVKPAAEEFLKALVANLRKALWNAYEGQAKELKDLADFAESRRHDAANDLEIAMGIHSPDRMQIQEQLDTIVNLSMLLPEMSFSEAIDELKDAVEPPLPIVVLWKELLDSCDIEPTTPIDMDGLPGVRVGTALKLLVEAVSGGLTDISYQIDGGVIVIREEEQQTPPPTFSTTRNEVDIRDLDVRRRQLTRQAELLQMELAIKAARERAIQEQMARVRDETDSKLVHDTVTEELQKLIAMSSDHLSTLQRQVETGRLPQSDLTKARENLTRARIELARRREELSKTAGGERLVELNKDLSVMAIDKAEMTAQLQIVHKQLDETQQEWTQVSRFDPKAARVRIAQEVLDIAEGRLIELKRRLVNLQLPSVTMIGAN